MCHQKGEMHEREMKNQNLAGNERESTLKMIQTMKTLDGFRMGDRNATSI